MAIALSRNRLGENKNGDHYTCTIFLVLPIRHSGFGETRVVASERDAAVYTR